MNRAMIDELNELSQKYLGSKSKWRKIVDKGLPFPSLKTVEIEEKDESGNVKMVPKQVQEISNGMRVSHLKRYDEETILTELRRIDSQVKEAQEKAEQARKQREAEEKVHNELAGSVS